MKDSRTFVDPETKYHLTKFAELYDSVPKIPELSDAVVRRIEGTEEFKAFSKATGSPIALVNIAKHNDEIPHYVPFYDFYKENPIFWLIPCEIPGHKAIGFILRSFEEKPIPKSSSKKRSYYQFTVKGTMPIVYGLHAFGDFQRNTTIILVEGVKDALFLSQYYPYVIAVLTNSVSDYICMMIQRLTNSVVFAFDVDAGGKRHENKLTKRFRELVVKREFLKTSRSVKDWANFFSTGLQEDQLREEMHSIMKYALDQVGDSAKLLY